MADFLSNKPYKGSRDFFPDEMRVRDWFFKKIAELVESYGYEKIDAPLIEPIDLYLAKTSEEIVNQQIYSFIDRGDRKVAIRPEMTPTVSRMVSQKIRELAKPIRWYCTPNLWRYEKPGKGRLREHWQLNVDLFGAADVAMADLEILTLAIELLQSFGAKEGQFVVKVNDRQLINAFLTEALELPAEKHAAIARVLDKKEKLSSDVFHEQLENEKLTESQINTVDAYFTQGLEYFQKNKTLLENSGSELPAIIQRLNELQLGKFIKYDPTVIRGFDYYTGMIFEVFDSHPENRRSLFGGGRYDNLVGYFGRDKTSAVGFGMGDVTFVNFLKVNELIPNIKRKTQVYIVFMPGFEIENLTLAKELRGAGFNVEQSLGPLKMAKQLQEADKKNIAFVLIQGELEMNSGNIVCKTLSTGEQIEVPKEEIVSWLEASKKPLDKY